MTGTTSRLWASLLFILILLALMFAIPIHVGSLNARELPLMIVAALTIPYSISQWNSREIVALGAVFATSLVATAISFMRFSSSFPEYAKACASLAIAHVTSYLIYTFVLSLGPQRTRSLLSKYVVVLITFCILEVIFPQVSQLSSYGTNYLYHQNSDTNFSAEFHADRDIQLHGGIPRPLAFTQEPSFPAISLAITLTMIAVIPAFRGRSSPFAYLLGIISAVITRSPSFIAAFISGITGKWALRISLGSVLAIAIGGTLSFGILYPILQARLENVLQGNDGSFKVRTVCPVVMVPTVYEETFGLYGIGIIGSLHDYRSNKLSDFEDIWVKTIQRSNAEGLFWAAERMSIPLGFFPAVTHWAYLGVPLGLLSCYFWYRFYAVRQGRAAIWMFPFFFGFSFAYGGYTMAGTHTYVLMVAAAYVFLVQHQREMMEYPQQQYDEPAWEQATH